MRKLLLPVLSVVAFILFQSVVVVQEGQRGIMLRFNKVHRDADNKVIVYEPGLHFKVPVIDQLKTLDARIQTLDGQEDRFVTVEKKDLLVDSYVKWKISDFGQFYTSTGGDTQKASTLLQRKVNDRLRSEIGSRTIKDIVSGSRGELMAGAQKALNDGEDGAERLGIEVVDVRVKQINLPNEVSASIYQRMQAERAAVAREHRSQGEEKAEFIRADVDKKVVLILANANKTAEELKGQGDAEAAKIYAEAFKQEPEFYSFVRSLKAYEESFAAGSNNMMLLKPDSEFFRFMKAPTK
ncbi:protease modulator HflC [Glaesserella parasuis]|uniref:Protein HflC n=2 Tax=Glaesserella parasuis TaxID=738 RepID=B8F8E7_GLAP5|nr:protease modulator HflC [Glaesserella parasuis]AGO16730.1 protein HflC/membrane protease subunit, stomatin/prohibitin-like protein [Glaesserella parasuis ZJ0906]EQA04663.1 HflC protein [Glaesserella parasuis 12939]ACL33599.1 protein HflC/membrane protease subunit, stomatin/prohibitin-like protein [Glaesserella parasuis SH0165]EMY46978.1 protein HflC/membrane protease subunit, stomatin/prohibitin-like protein [Glaesserella parasuis gx033]MCT8546836.1 protease modulator HflC [Glaesserella par